MACDSLLTTSVLQVVNRLVCKLIVKTCYPKAFCKLFQQVVTSLQMPNATSLWHFPLCSDVQAILDEITNSAQV